jgi:preprotein translocase subunit SecG
MGSEVKWGISAVAGAGLVALGWKFYPVLVTVHVILCFLLIVVVLLQSGKAADLAGAFGGAGSQTAFGPRSAASFLTRATTWCFVMFLLTTISIELRQNAGAGASSGTSILERTQKPAPQQAPAPFGGTQAPVQGQPTAPAGQQAPPASQQAPPPASPSQPAPQQKAPEKAPAKTPEKAPAKPPA